MFFSFSINMPVTITRTTTTSSNTSYIVLNTGYLKTWSGLLKALELILGVICVVILAFNFDSYYSNQLFFFNMTVCFMVGTFVLLLSCLVSLNTGSIISKTIYVSFDQGSLYQRNDFVILFSGSFISYYCWGTTFDIFIDLCCEPKQTLFQQHILDSGSLWSYQFRVVYFKCFLSK